MFLLNTKNIFRVKAGTKETSAQPVQFLFKGIFTETLARDTLNILGSRSDSTKQHNLLSVEKY